MVDAMVAAPQVGEGAPVTASDFDDVVPSRSKGRVVLWLAAGWVILMLLIAVFADLLPLRSVSSIVPGLKPRSGLGLRAEFLGSDAVGRSELSRLVYGAQASLMISVLSTTIGMVAGLVIGICAGYFRGKVDAVVGVILDSLLSVPALVLLLALASVGKRDLKTLIGGLAIVSTPTFARLARGATLSLAERNYIAASRVMGATNIRVMFRELLPEVVVRVSSFAFLSIAFVIVAEGSLSFLGLGIRPPRPSWGAMINDGRADLSMHPSLVLLPSACMFFTVTAFTVLGDWARRRFDTRGSAL